MPSNYVSSIEVTNNNTDSMLIYIEPWADEFILPPGDNLTVEFDGTEKGEVAINYVREGLQIYGFNGSFAIVKKAGKIIWKAHARCP